MYVFLLTLSTVDYSEVLSSKFSYCFCILWTNYEEFSLAWKKSIQSSPKTWSKKDLKGIHTQKSWGAPGGVPTSWRAFYVGSVGW